MSNGTPGTCHYCPNKATQNVVWLRDKEGQPARIVLPHCGCDLGKALQRLFPSSYRIRLGFDYETEPMGGASPDRDATGNGLTVTLKLRKEVGGISCPFEITMTKQQAREYARKIQEASNLAEPGCTDPTDHFRGHCGCK